MAIVNDFLLNEDLTDMTTKLGFKESTETQQRTLILSFEGEIKDAPQLGVGLEQYLNDDTATDTVVNAIREKLILDNQKINVITGTAENLTVYANYND